MGKIVEKKKKKGRPSLLDIQKRNLLLQQQQQLSQTTPNSSNPNFKNSPHRKTFTPRTSDDDDEIEDQQKDKKFKVVLKLNSHRSVVNSQEFDNVEGEESDNLLKKRKINEVEGRSDYDNDEKEEKHNPPSKPTDTTSGVAMETGPGTPFPDKKLLVFILDRLQKKDTYGVYSEPVDPKELPDYFEIVENPMDFGTVRKKLSSGAYASLEQFEEDVFLICTNAMKYNASDTIYFRQARSILELAKKDFENLRQGSDHTEFQPKRRGRPPTKNLKKRLGRPPLERLGSDPSSNATLANAGDNVGSSSYDLRRGPFSGRSSPSPNYNGEMFAWSADNKSETNDEFSASMLKGISMKYGKKNYVLDENRRTTYNLSHSLNSGHTPSVLATFEGEKKQLMAVGLHTEHGFARSLARFAATLGPIAWKIASKKIERALPTGVKYGPGWVGEIEAPSTLSSIPFRGPPHVWPQQSFSLQKLSSTTTPSVLDVKVHEVQDIPSSSSLVGNISHEPTRELGGTSREVNPELEHIPTFQNRQGSLLKSSMNGFIVPPQSTNHTESDDPRLSGCLNTGDLDTSAVVPNGQAHGGVLQTEHRISDPVPPDLNVKFQSPISPPLTQQQQNPDLVLQL
ncbi:hypothetical protein ACHQM5_015852 [Ranunculus cassubicifolius]